MPELAGAHVDLALGDADRRKRRGQAVARQADQRGLLRARRVGADRAVLVGQHDGRGYSAPAALSGQAPAAESERGSAPYGHSLAILSSAAVMPDSE